MPQNVPEGDPTTVLSNHRKEWFLGSLVNRIPFTKPRARLYERIGGVQFEAVDDTLILRGVEILEPQRLQIGRGTVINRKVLLDARGGLEIGRDVGIAERTVVLSAAHGFEGGVTDHIWRTRIEDKVFINLGAMIMGGVTIGEGAVIAAGALVTRDVEPWTIVAGTPAKKIADRTPCDYQLYRRSDKNAYRADWR
jgi:acetyltransferase-like isoleucine patch superfamily enzyme